MALDCLVESEEPGDGLPPNPQSIISDPGRRGIGAGYLWPRSLRSRASFRRLIALRDGSRRAIYGILTFRAYFDPMNEHRIAPRRRVLKAGSIAFGGGAIDCTVRNLSETGAALEVVTPLFIPDRFILVVPSDQLKRPCHVAWRKDRRIGVAFDPQA